MAEDWRLEMVEAAKLANVKRLDAMPYGQYLQSFEWKQTRRAALERANYLCAFCRDDGYLQVHHTSYERVGREEEDDLLVVCPPCHEAITPARKGMVAKLKKLAAQKGVAYVEPQNLGEGKAMLRELEELPHRRSASDLAFWRLADAQQGIYWPSCPLGIRLAIEAERQAL